MVSVPDDSGPRKPRMYPCAADVFAATYEPAETPDTESPAPVPEGRSAAATATPGRDSGPAHKPGPKRMIGRSVTQDCWGCGQRWPCDGSWQARAEAAEGKLSEVRALLEETRLGAAPHVTPSLSVQRILAIIGGEGEPVTPAVYPGAHAACDEQVARLQARVTAEGARADAAEERLRAVVGSEGE